MIANISSECGKFKYFGTMVTYTYQNLIQYEMKRRVNNGTASYRSVPDHFPSSDFHNINIRIRKVQFFQFYLWFVMGVKIISGITEETLV
jgi:hypothetical protein